MRTEEPVTRGRHGDGHPNPAEQPTSPIAPSPPTQPPPTQPPPTQPPPTQSNQEEVSDIITENGHQYKIICTQEGSIAHPGNVHKYIVCEYLADHKHWHVTVMPCSIGTRWSDEAHNCVNDE